MRVGVCSKAREMYRVRRSAHPRGPELIARVPIRSGKVGDWILWFAKTLADFEINGIAALPPLLCYNS